jgi:hypothetical protein
VVPAVVVVVPVVVVVESSPSSSPFGFAASAHVPEASWSQTSPLAIRFFAAFAGMLMRTHLPGLPVRWPP